MKRDKFFLALYFTIYLMTEAVKEELAEIKAGNTSAKQYRFIETPVQKLKKAIYKAYLKESNEFKESIYKS